MIHSLSGLNFSGKSFYMQCYSGFPIETVRESMKDNNLSFRDNRTDLYIGPIPDYYFSGFFSTVKGELFRLQNKNSLQKPLLNELLSNINLFDLNNRNPFTLSGGEKAIVSTLAFALSNPRCLCIDCTLEQLSYSWKISFLNFLINLSLPEIIMADNRISELPKNLFTPINYTPIDGQHSLNLSLRNIESSKLTALSNSEKKKLEITSLSFSYKGHPLFFNSNFKFETGNIYHLKGENGSGKSTLSKILSGIIKPGKDTRISLNNSRVYPYNYPGQIVSYAFQQPDDQLFSGTVGQEVGLFKNTNRENNLYVHSLVESFGLLPLIDAHPFELPVSMRKRLSILSSLTVNRPFYILDEPTLYLDDKNVSELKLVLEKLGATGKGIIIISHSENFISSFQNVEIIDINQTLT